MKKGFHPFIIACLPALFAFLNNLGKVSFTDVLLPLFILLVSAGLLVLIFKLVFKSYQKAFIYSSWILFFTLSYRYFSYIIPEFTFIIAGFYLGPDKLLIAGFVVLSIFLFIILFKTRKKLYDFNAAINIAAVTFLLLQSINIIQFLHSRPHKTETVQKTISSSDNVSSLGYNPNIYYIILDAYARSDVLKELYDYDNSDMIKQLKDLGFFVAEDCYANYCQTALSLASSMNLDYHNDLVKQYGTDIRFMHPLKEKINNGVVINHLKQYNYKIASFQSSSYEWSKLDHADEMFYMPGIGMNMLHDHIINMTIFPLLLKDKFFPINSKLKMHRKRILFTMQKVENRASIQGPYFNFVHILCPHRPFVFDRDGNFRNPGMNYEGLLTGAINIRNPKEYRENYKEQVCYLSKRIVQMVKRILENSEKPPIIILQSDHGPSAEMDNFEPVQTNTSNFKERMAILNAYYFPDKNFSQLYSDISPVNTFCVVLNQYFDTDFELKNDSSYFSNLKQIYDFINVTNELKK